MIAGNQDIGEAFIVPQQHVIFRLELLDQVLFKQQRFGLCVGRQKHHRRGVRNHRGNPRGMARWARVIADAVLEAAGLADVQNPGLAIQHPVHPRRAVKRAQVALDNVISSRDFGDVRAHVPNL